MNTILKFSGKKNTGFLTLYVLHTLKNKPKSGYEILSELKDNGSNGISPSKGTLYPLLKSLEKDELIKLKRIDARSKNIFEITKKGRKVLTDFRKEKEALNERFLQFQSVFANILGEQKTSIISHMIEIKKIALKKNNDKVLRELKSCLEKIKKI